MSFPVNSTSVITSAIKRLHPVLFRTKADKPIISAGVFNCRKIAGSTSWSEHSWGNASDLFTANKEDNRLVANVVVFQATNRTKANRGRKLNIDRVIDHENSRMWVRGSGWSGYSGAKGLHVHAEGPDHSGTPPCA